MDEKEIIFTFENNLPPGDYQIISKVFYDNYLLGQQIAPFKIVASGTLPQEPETIIESQETIPLSSTPTMIVGVLILAIIVYYGIRKKKRFRPAKEIIILKNLLHTQSFC